MSNPQIDNLSDDAKATWKEIVALWHRYGFKDIAIDLTNDLSVENEDFRKVRKRLAYEELEKQGLVQIEEVILDFETNIIAGWTFAVYPTDLATELARM